MLIRLLHRTQKLKRMLWSCYFFGNSKLRTLNSELSWLHITMSAEPSHGFLQCHFRRRLREAEFTDGFAAIVVHLVFRHLHAFEWDAWRVARKIRDPLIGM